MSRNAKGSWIGVGLLSLALLIAILLGLETISYALGAMLSAALWLAVGSYFPKRLSEYSTGQKIYLGVTVVLITFITAILVVKTVKTDQGMLSGSVKMATHLLTERAS
ncbi:hypothetical protein [Calditerricola satsumensis]|uniref:Uncharacterized protein n=1 Tax=Calditerricola satsumensis TaxID=373054 RepID=A0A8J3BC84_9BACI|nr:hypothetical protein [Calditerricola satsumensis]GGK08793.1 hypothetical protein GCM10007043_23520 [Calditerricola satsumensis]